MKRTWIFAKRNMLEMSRDVLSYIFCAAFPIVMLVVMSVVDQSIPAEANMTLFRIDNLLGGIIVFGHTFLMLFTALAVSQDRSSSFLMRLYAAPMTSSNFTNGYILPMIFIGVLQSVISILAAAVISALAGHALQPAGLLLLIVGAVPSAVMFIAIGLIFGTLLNRNAAPGLCSVIISLGSFVGGIWFDAEGIGGALGTVCRCFPFLYATRLTRACIHLEFTAQAMGIPLIVTCGTAAILLVLASVLFRRKMRADLA